MFGGNALGWAYLGEAYAGASGTARSLSLADTVTLTDGIAKTSVLAKSDTFTLSEALAKAVVAAKAETLTLADVVAKAMTLSEADTLTLAEQISNAIGVPLADTVSLEDAQATVSAFILALADTVTMTDEITLPQPTTVITAVGGSHAVVRETSPMPRHLALRLNDTITLSDEFSIVREPDAEAVDEMFADLEQLLALDLIPA